MITHAEVRAVALAKLNIGPGVMWDIGAGFGSVGIEAVGLCECLDVYAVEKKEDRAGYITRNAAASGAGVTVVCGHAPEIIPQLPAPRSVFIGGGGKDVAEILQKTYERLQPGGCIVAAAVMLETRTALMSVLESCRTEITEIAVRHGKTMGPGTRMVPASPVTLCCFKKQE